MPERYPTDQDKNFDDLSHHFKRNIYGKLKGQIRLAVLNRDLAPYIQGEPRLNIIDAGGGQGQFAISLAEQGHHISLCDISQNMLDLAKQEAENKNIRNIKYYHCPLQALSEKIDDKADLLLCHAVLEWMANPREALTQLSHCLKEKGVLSLAFFNVNSIIYKNLLRGNFNKAISGDYVGIQGSLTPINPLNIETVFSWCKEAGFEIKIHSGIRVFHDYIIDQVTRNRHPDALIDMELKFSQQEPFRSLGRYIHIVAQKK